MTIKWNKRYKHVKIRDNYTEQEYKDMRKKAKKIKESENKEDFKPSKENWI